MGDNIIINDLNICRICLKNKDLISIRGISEQTNLEYCEMFEFCTRIMVSENDGMPLNICTGCATLLETVYNFQNTIYANDNKLRNFVMVKEEDEAKEEECEMPDDYDEEDNKPLKYFKRSENSCKIKREKDPPKIKEKRRKYVKQKHPCSICEEVLTSRTTLRVHRKEVHGYVRQKSIYTCQTCQKSFPRQQALTVHERTHTGERPHACDLCPARFRQISALSAHRRTHDATDRPYLCAICGRAFGQASTLAHHMQGLHHAGELRYKCEVCGKRFATNGNLRIHQRFHSSVKKYVCEFDGCTASFYTSSHLSVHRKRHSDIREHECQLCGKRFAMKSFLREHLRIHSGERPFQCDDCGKKYTQRTHLNRHKRDAHAKVTGNKVVPKN